MKMTPKGNPERLNPAQTAAFRTQLSNIVRAEISSESPGHIAASWQTQLTSDGFKVGSYLPESKYTELGTGLWGPNHDFIRPIRAQVMIWYEDGKKIVAKKTRGQPPQLYVWKVLRRLFGQANIKPKR